VLLAILMLSAAQCGEPGAQPVGPHPATELTEIVGAPEHVWCVSLLDGRLGEPQREPHGESLSWDFADHETSTASNYVECFPLVEVGRRDVEMRNQIAGYLREDVHQTVGADTWTRYRKVSFEEARGRRSGQSR
jgi:hypothetical protein